MAQCNTCHSFWRSLHRKKCALRRVRSVCVQHRPEHDSDGTAVTVHVTTAYRDSRGIFLLFSTTALHGVSSTLGDYSISDELFPGRVWAFLEIWDAHGAAHSLVTPDCLTLVHRLSLNCRRLCCAKRVLHSRFLYIFTSYLR